MAREKGSPKTGGRTKGTPNKLNAALKDAILNTLEKAGGEEYLLTVAKADYKTFCSLLGRVLPLQIGGDKENPIQLETIKRVITDPRNTDS